MAQTATVYEPIGKRILLLLMCLTFGIELGFKFATRQMIWIGNPCHLATMMQIFILSAPPSRIVTAAFRLHMHMLTGAPIAILFPVINTRLLPFETGVYFLQHILMLIIPFYCLYVGDPFIPEKLGDFSWAMTSFGLLFLYHFIPLQFLAYVSQVNLNNMLCPAVSDPFRGKFYRLFAIGHQFVLIPTLGKVFVLLAKGFGIIARDSPQDCQHAVTVIITEDCSDPCRGVTPKSCNPCCDVILKSCDPCCDVIPKSCDPCRDVVPKSCGPCGTVTNISKGRICRIPKRPSCAAPSSSLRYCSSRSSRSFYRQKLPGCLKDCSQPCPCCNRFLCKCRSPCRKRNISPIPGNRCRSNTSGVTNTSTHTDDNNSPPKQGDAGTKPKEQEVEDEEDSGFLGGTFSGETTPMSSNSTIAAAAANGSCFAQIQVGQGETSGQQDSSDGESCNCCSYCYTEQEKLSDDSGSSTESQRHQDSRTKTLKLSLNKQQMQLGGGGGGGGCGDGQAGGIEDMPVQHIINGKIVERSSGEELKLKNPVTHLARGSQQTGQTVRHRGNGSELVLSSSSGSSGSLSSHQQRKSREIVVEGGPPLRVFELKNCGNSSKVTSSVERALSVGGPGGKDVDDSEDNAASSDFLTFRSKVH
ncbi:hypothetical protein EGW08_001203 [Elysia chlorotica]|uniref:Transmembrane protein 164 n=1 Tax=Elysia chlorotica TaxID=188477 RepID=A0A3S1BTP2_ELYCH|nr:hypothetical protein EGW08_001203 [Elysia chlorotica]